MAWTQADLDALDEAFKSGASSIGHGDKRVTFRSVEEYKALRRMMLEDLLDTGARPRVMSALVTHSRR